MSPQSEQPFSLNNATQVWWFLAWRSVLVYLLLVLPVTWVLSGWFSPDSAWADIVELVGTLILLLAQIFFIRLAVNRDYRSKSTGNFRLAALRLDDQVAAETRVAPIPPATESHPTPVSSFAPHSVTDKEPVTTQSFTPESVAKGDGVETEAPQSRSPFTPHNVK